MHRNLLYPDWPVAPRVRAMMTLRTGGVSEGPWGDAQARAGGLNLGDHCGDDPQAVGANRARVRRLLPAEPAWLRQVHGVAVVDADRIERGAVPVADASVACRPGTVCAVLTADCLPVLMAAVDGSAVAAAHAGWRGLADGVLEAGLSALRGRATPGVGLVAWLGAAIGPSAFEVGAEVKDRFCDADAGAASAFAPGAKAGKWMADLPALAHRRLAAAGVQGVTGGRWCTASDARRFYSFRRDGVTGRMGAFVWLEGVSSDAGACGGPA